MSPIAPRLLENEYVAVKQCRHGLFAYNVNDVFIGASLDAYGEWAESELSVLFQLVKPGDIVLDVGANIGTLTVPLARKVTAAGAVFAFEPQRLVYQLLCANVALNALVNVSCFNAAVGDARGNVRIPTLNPAVQANFGALRAEGHEQGELRETIRIDDLPLPRCNLIKVDVEGLESRVLKGARKTIETHRPVLFMENNDEERSPSLLQQLDKLGYQAWWHIADVFNADNYFGNRERIFVEYREGNVLCFPKEARARVNMWPVEGLDDTHVKALRRHLIQRLDA
jgi:FkbM family methyltransferase